jgi:hypothetical protein
MAGSFGRFHLPRMRLWARPIALLRTKAAKLSGGKLSTPLLAEQRLNAPITHDLREAPRKHESAVSLRCFGANRTMRTGAPDALPCGVPRLCRADGVQRRHPATRELDDVIYACAKCGAETTRTLKRA